MSNLFLENLFPDNGWKEVLKEEFKKDYFKELSEKIEEKYLNEVVFPPKEDLFNAFKYTDFNDVKVVILGQDPYHEKGQAHGLSFSVKGGVKLPPSLRNIYKEIKEETGVDNLSEKESGYLKKWADSGILLLNTILTVKEHEALSHKNLGWEKFTDAAIKALNDSDRKVVFILWGNHSIKKKGMITNENALVLTGAHPSPLSAYRGFFGCMHFRDAKNFLEDNGISGIDWEI